jgi:hypothetical protein
MAGVRQIEERAHITDRRGDVGHEQARVEHRVVDAALAVHAGHRFVGALPVLRSHGALVERGRDTGLSFLGGGSPALASVHAAAFGLWTAALTDSRIVRGRCNCDT